MKGQIPKLVKLAILGAIAAVLSACSTTVAPPESSTDTTYSHTITLDISHQDDAQEMAAQYNADVLVWQPEAEFAILGIHAGAFSTLINPNLAEPSIDTIRTPEAAASGYDAWGGGYDAWGGGFDAWGGGHSDATTTFSQNEHTWNQVDLINAQNLAPQLGAGITVAVIDSGFDLSHPAFKGKLAAEYLWQDFVDGDNWPQDTGYGHGTAVAGVILQVAPNVSLLPIRVLDEDGMGDLANVVLAIHWAIESGADVIHLSLGTDYDFKALKKMLKLAKKEDIIVVASAGNYGQDLEFPARYGDRSVAVGSVDGLDNKSAFSAHGRELDLVAPGEVIYSLAPNEQIAYWTGTSFAAPMITGAIALANAELDKPLNASNIESRLAKACDDIKKQGDNKKYKLGAGRLNIANFLEIVLDD